MEIFACSMAKKSTPIILSGEVEKKTICSIDELTFGSVEEAICLSSEEKKMCLEKTA